MAKIEAYGGAQKDFFIDMLTRDISLIDCVLDLLDNCIDGANRDMQQKRVSVTKSNRFASYFAHIEFNGKKFSVSDNCAGIPLAVAKDYAFAFGKVEGAPEARHSIGLYGIGMKRALFKMGDVIDIASATATDSFSTRIDVPTWRKKDKDWNFELNAGASKRPYGTSISVTTLHADVALDFSDAEFVDELEKTISRDYMFILDKGFSIKVNGRQLKPLKVCLLSGEGYQPMRQTSKFRGADRASVDFELIAGLWKRADPKDDDPTSNVDVDPGWYVVCNDRIVLSADTTSRTGWGVDKYIERKWHSQYKPFIGFAFFSSDDPKLLPWTTTKRGVDLNSDIYRQALVKMTEATEIAIEYTNSRKSNRHKAEQAEEKTRRVELLKIKTSSSMKFPEFQGTSERLATISYQVSERRLRRVKLAIGNPVLPNRDVGTHTFEYFYNSAVEG